MSSVNSKIRRADPIKQLIDDNRKLRRAGCKLALAAIRVVNEYDGCHRLALAVSEWTATIANEGGRGKTK